MPAPHPRLVTMAGEPSWPLRSSHVEAHVTRDGAHVGVTSMLAGRRRVAPMHLAPWAGERLPRDTPAILRVLRGDFFCLPFGGNGTAWRGERHTVHGETANRAWTCEGATDEGAERVLRLSLRTRTRPGLVRRAVRLLRGQPAVYQRTTISGMSGPMSIGQHAMLRFDDGPGLVATAPFVHGQVFPGAFERPEQGGYSALRAGAEFGSLRRVPMIDGSDADLTRYPARRGFEDLIMLVTDPAQTLGWTAVTFPERRFVWFSLKDTRVLRNTIFWMSNGGRHYAPWSGRHVHVMGLEETTSYFHYGLAESAAANPLSRRGHATCVRLDPVVPLTVNAIFGVVAVPARFGAVEAIEPQGDGIALRSGRLRVRAAVDLPWLGLA